jgi:hypothetical protein
LLNTPFWTRVNLSVVPREPSNLYHTGLSYPVI